MPTIADMINALQQIAAREELWRAHHAAVVARSRPGSTAETIAEQWRPSMWLDPRVGLRENFPAPMGEGWYGIVPAARTAIGQGFYPLMVDADQLAAIRRMPFAQQGPQLEKLRFNQWEGPSPIFGRATSERDAPTVLLEPDAAPSWERPLR
jgi:hypothetical protein